jgi:hypothetical protein
VRGEFSNKAKQKRNLARGRIALLGPLKNGEKRDIFIRSNDAVDTAHKGTRRGTFAHESIAPTVARKPTEKADMSESMELPAFVAELVSQLEAQGLPLPAIVALAIVVFWILAKLVFGTVGGSSSGGGDSVLLVGACGAGKTSLFQMLRAGSTFEGSVTSMSENEERFAVEGKLGKKGVVSKQVHVVDLPGHPRLRAKVDKYLGGCKGVVFLVDAVDFTSQRRAVAEQLFDLLSNPVIQRRTVPILLVRGLPGLYYYTIGASYHHHHHHCPHHYATTHLTPPRPHPNNLCMISP